MFSLHIDFLIFNSETHFGKWNICNIYVACDRSFAFVWTLMIGGKKYSYVAVWAHQTSHCESGRNVCIKQYFYMQTKSSPLLSHFEMNVAWTVQVSNSQDVCFSSPVMSWQNIKLASADFFKLACAWRPEAVNLFVIFLNLGNKL